MITKQVVKNITAGRISVYRDVLLYPVFKIRLPVNKSEEMTSQMPFFFMFVSKHVFFYILLLRQAIKQYFLHPIQCSLSFICIQEYINIK